MRVLSTVLGALAAMSLASCTVSFCDWNCDCGEELQGSGVRASETRSPGAFDSISLSGAFELEVEVGGPQEVVVSADDNLLANVETETVDGELRIRTRDSYSTRGAVEVRVRLPVLRALSASGSSRIVLREMRGERLSLELSGSHELTARGTVDELALTASGSSELDLGLLVARSARVSTSGSSEVVLHATDSLALDLAGSSAVRYRGRPRVELSQSGAAEVLAID